MKRRIIYTALALVLGFNLYYGGSLYLNSAEADARADIYTNFKVFSTVVERVREHYVDADKVSYNDLIDAALKGMLSRLDPHSAYMDPKQYEAMQSDTRGEFGGIGIEVGVRNGVLTIIAPIDDSPGAREGLLSGDQIIKIAGQSTERMTLPESVDKLRGKVGTSVSFTIRRPASGEIRDLTIMRERIVVRSARDIQGKDEFALPADKIGYVRLTAFGERTTDEFEAALVKLESKGLRALVLDLRDNPGGLLDQAVRVSEVFLPKGQLIVSTEGRHPGDKKTHVAEGLKKTRKYPVAILVNSGSASAAEIVAGCLKDLKRAELVGELTFGKGSVQTILTLNNGAALRLTTAKYYTPSHIEIHNRGITPNHVVSLTLEQQRDLSLKRSPSGLALLTAAERERIMKVQDTQLNKALEVLKAKLTGATDPEKN